MYSIKKERYYFYEFETFNFELKRIFSNYNELIYFLAYAQVDKLQISRKEKIYHKQKKNMCIVYLQIAFLL